MQDILVLFMIIVVSYLILSLFIDTKEHYVTSIVGYNNIDIPAYQIPNLFDTETQELTTIFKKLFKDDIDITDFKEHNPYISFPFESIIKKYLIDYMKINIDKFKGHKLEISSDLNKLSYKDIGQDRLFIFNINLIDNTQFMTRNLLVKIKIKDINNLIKNASDYGFIDKKEEREIDYKTNVPSQTVMNSIELLSIRLDKNNYARFELSGVDNLRPNYYQIKNVLGLMDPFVTSGRDMIITNEMKKDFEKELEEHQKLLTNKTK
jgi:hypothetical protein